MVNETTELNTPELRFTTGLLIGLLVVNFLVYVAILIPLSLNTDPDWFQFIHVYPVYSIAIIAGYYILEGSLFFGCRVRNWPCMLTIRIICFVKLFHNFTYCFTYAVEAAGSKGTYYYPFNLACTVFFLLALGLEYGIIVTFSKLVNLGCCEQTTPTQNGDLEMVRNPNVEGHDANFGVTQQAPVPRNVRPSNQTSSAAVEQCCLIS